MALVFFGVVLALGWPGRAWADGRACEGPLPCCQAALAQDFAGHVDLSLGVTLVGLYNVNEKAGTWDADFYLQEVWTPTAGFTPQTEIVNEVVRVAQQFDTTELRRGRCLRSRRIRSTLYAPYDLRTFPFDHQRLVLVLSDAEFPAPALTYAERPTAAEIDDAARGQLSSWKLDGGMSYTHAARIFRGDDGAPLYDYATFSLPIKRHVTFHLTKFFLPLFIIVATASLAFWINPEDLNSRSSIGVTCLLAAIAFQLADAGSLPEVAYLTLADRVYAICYVALGVAMVGSIYANALARKGAKERALALDRRARRAFPAALLAAIALGVLRAIL